MKNSSLPLEAALSRQLLIGEILKRQAIKYPDMEGFIFKEHRITYQYMEERANRLGNALIGENVKKGEKIAILMQNRQELLEIFHASAKIGSVNVPINIRLSPPEIAYILNNSESKIVFVEQKFLQVIEQITGDVKFIEQIILVGESTDKKYPLYENIISKGDSRPPTVFIKDDDDVFIIYTAGTTGRPKGALISHKNLVCNTFDMLHETSLSHHRKTDLPNTYAKALLVAPLFHVAGIANIVRTMIDRVPIVLRDFDPAEILRTIQSEKITYLFLVPAMWRILIEHPDFSKYDVNSVLRAGFGADVMSNHLKNRILECFPNASLFEAFGQTEMSATTVYMKHQDTLRKEGSVGLPLRMVNVRVVDDLMNDVATNEVGEIIYQGPGMFKGYYNNPDETRKAFEGGWFHSGDLVRRDEEGFFYVVDRKKDMILSGGENIYSAEVEMVLQMHPKIKEAAVVGVPDQKWGQAVKAFVVTFPGEEVTADEISDFCIKHLARFKRPKHITFLHSLPRSATGKVLKKNLRITR